MIEHAVFELQVQDLADHAGDGDCCLSVRRFQDAPSGGDQRGHFRCYATDRFGSSRPKASNGRVGLLALPALYPRFILCNLADGRVCPWPPTAHRPRPPDHISRIVQGPIKLNHAFILGLPVVLFLIGPLVLIHDVQSFRSEGLHPNRTVARWVIPALVWLGAFGIVWFRLFGVAEILDWYWD